MSTYNEFSGFLAQKKSKTRMSFTNQSTKRQANKKNFSFQSAPIKPPTATPRQVSQNIPVKNEVVAVSSQSNVPKKDVFQLLYYEPIMKCNVQPKPNVLKIDETQTSLLGKSSPLHIIVSETNPCTYVKITAYCSFPKKNEQCFTTLKLKEENNNKFISIDQKSIYTSTDCGVTYGPCIIPFTDVSKDKELLGMTKEKKYELQLYTTKSIMLNYCKLHIEYIYT